MISAYMLSIILSVVIVVAVCFALLLPFFKVRTEESQLLDLEIDELAARRDILLTELEDLEQDFRLEKISNGYYERSKNELTHKAARCLTRIDELQGN